MIGLRVQDRVDLRAALDLKRADRLAALNQLVRLRVVDRKLVHLRPLARALLDARRTRCAPSPARRVRESRTSARRSCRDRPCRTGRSCGPSSSARRADSCRAARAERTKPPTCVERRRANPSKPGSAVEQRPAARAARCRRRARRRLAGIGVDASRRLVAVHALRDLERLLGRIAERAHRVLHGGRRVEALRDRRDRRVRAVVVVVHVVEHFLATVVLEVDVDVRRLGAGRRRAPPTESARTSRPCFTGSTAVIAETERDRRVRGAAAPLAENALCAARSAPRRPSRERIPRSRARAISSQLVVDLLVAARASARPIARACPRRSTRAALRRRSCPTCRRSASPCESRAGEGASSRA